MNPFLTHMVAPSTSRCRQPVTRVRKPASNVKDRLTGMPQVNTSKGAERHPKSAATRTGRNLAARNGFV